MAATIDCATGYSGPMRPQEAEELHAFAQPAPHHFPAAQHLADDLPDFSRAEVEAFVEHFHAVEDLFLGQVRIADRGQLHAAFIDQIYRIVFLQPAILHRLAIQGRTRIRRGQRDLDGVRIDFLGEVYRLLDSLRRLTRKAENERAVDQDAKFAAVLGEAPRDVSAQPLLDVQQDL